MLLSLFIKQSKFNLWDYFSLWLRCKSDNNRRAV